MLSISCFFLIGVAIFLQLCPAGLPELTDTEDAVIIGTLSDYSVGDTYQIYYLEGAILPDNHLTLSILPVFVPEDLDYPIGTILYMKADLTPVEEASNPGEYDMRIYNLCRGITYQADANRIEVLSSVSPDFRTASFRCNTPDGRTVRIGSGVIGCGKYLIRHYLIYPVKDRLIRLKIMLCDLNLKLYPQEEAGVLNAMMFGVKTDLLQEIKDDYSRIGVSHILSISGLHISLLGASLYHFLKKLTVPLPVRAGVSGMVMTLYLLMIGYRVSAWRAVGMFLLLVIGDAIGRAYDRPTALAFSALVVVIHSPYELMDSGFYLSYGALIGITYGMAWNTERKRWKMRERKWMPILSLQLVLMPLIAYFLFELPIGGILWNTILLPVLPMAVGSGMTALLSSLVHPYAGAITGTIPYLLIKGINSLAALGASIPGMVRICGRPELWQMVCYYAALFAVLYLIWPGVTDWEKAWDVGQNLRRNLIVFGLYAGVTGSLLFYRRQAPVTIAFLDVGQGDCSVITTKSGLCAIIDCGSTSKKKVGENILIPYLKYRGISRVDYVFLSHGDEDHMGGLEELLSQTDVAVDCLVLASQATDKPDEIRELAQNAGIPVKGMGAGDYIEDAHLRITCLAPDGQKDSGDSKIAGLEGESENNHSLILMAEGEGVKTLFTGDMEAKEEMYLRELYSGADELYSDAGGLDLLDADILKTPHHGSKTSSSEWFLSCVTPKLSVISCAKKNFYGHPNKETVERLQGYGVVYETMNSGAVTLECSGGWIRERSYN